LCFGEADRFLGSQSGAVQAAGERDQPPTAALLADGVEQRADLDGVGDPPPVDTVRELSPPAAGSVSKPNEDFVAASPSVAIVLDGLSAGTGT
jgi:hypothetical protein